MQGLSAPAPKPEVNEVAVKSDKLALSLRDKLLANKRKAAEEEESKKAEAKQGEAKLAMSLRDKLLANRKAAAKENGGEAASSVAEKPPEERPEHKEDPMIEEAKKRAREAEQETKATEKKKRLK
jgi:hypothetical protein